VSPEPSSPQPPVPQPRKSSKTPSTDPAQEHPVNDAEQGDDLDVPENVPAEAAPAAEDPQSADVPATAAADEADSSGLPASTDAGYVLKEAEDGQNNLAANSSDGATTSPPPPPLPTFSNLEMNGGTAVGDIRSAFAFLDKEGGGRESSLEPSWEGMTGSGGSSGSSAAFSGNDGGACIEVNLVRNRLSIFERLSQQANNADAPINRPTFYRRTARAKSEARERVCSPGPPPAARAPVSFSERVRRISEQEAVIYEGMARNAAEDHEDAAPPTSVGHFPLKTQIQENVISEYTRKHSMEPHHPSSPPPPLAATKEAVAPSLSTAAQPPAAAAQSPTKTGFTHHHLRLPTTHAQQSPTMESIQRSLGLTEVERPASVRDKTPEEVVDAAAVRRSLQQRPALAGGGGGTYTLQKSGFSVTLKNQRGATATDPAARKQVYTQYRELLKKFSHHREETV
jgi:hypothetical protein